MPLQSQGKRRSAAQDLPVKRFRVSRACDRCRTERSKCDGNQPQCAPCFEGNKACTYTSNPKKRGLPPGYIRTIELALALVLQDADIEASLINRLGQQNAVLLARDTKESNRLYKSWRRTKFCRELNKALTGEQTCIDDARALSSADDSDSDPPMNNGLCELRETRDLPGPVIQQSEGVLRVNHQPAMPQSSSLPQELTPLPPECWQLLENYSTYTQCWLPISEKLDVLKLSYSYPIEGIMLSADMSESGNHAEMWSMFALGSYQSSLNSHDGRSHLDATSPRRLYSIAQSLIPSERGQFHLGHVKALLNLALFNLQGSFHNAAWILVGTASRILSLIEESPRRSSTRHRHVVASCYLLDNLLALLLDRHAYLDRSDIIRVGSIEEDGLEEWQSWVGELQTGTGHLSRLPILSLSTFNRLVDVIDVLVATKSNATARDEKIKRLTAWKSTLSPKFDYVRTDSTTIPLTPPAVLLQLTHFATAFALSPSRDWLQRILDLLELCQGQLELIKLPPVIICLLESITTSSKNLPLDQATQSQINEIIINFPVTLPSRSGAAIRAPPNTTAGIYAQEPFSQAESSQPSIQSLPSRFDQPTPARTQQRHERSSLLNDLLPDMDSGQQEQVPQIIAISPNQLEPDLTSPALDAYDPSISGDLENFFDELASLHGAKKLQNQPQFMQNLGFAPEASMADLLATQSGQYFSMDPSTYGTENEDGPLQFSLGDYYDAS